MSPCRNRQLIKPKHCLFRSKARFHLARYSLRARQVIDLVCVLCSCSSRPSALYPAACRTVVIMPHRKSGRCLIAAQQRRSPWFQPDARRTESQCWENRIPAADGTQCQFLSRVLLFGAPGARPDVCRSTGVPAPGSANPGRRCKLFRLLPDPTIISQPDRRTLALAGCLKAVKCHS
jgi:hypothetical protein